MGQTSKIRKEIVDKIEQSFYYLLTPRSKEDKSLEKKENEIELTETELRILSALRDPIKGPTIRNILESDDE